MEADVLEEWVFQRLTTATAEGEKIRYHLGRQIQTVDTESGAYCRSLFDWYSTCQACCSHMISGILSPRSYGLSLNT